MRILILCTGNSCRSQMAEGFLQSFDSKVEVYSAGTEPADEVHPLAVQVMREEDIDLSHHRPKLVDRFLEQEFDYVITVCDHANETCPMFTGSVKQRLHMGFEDPAAAKGTETEILEQFRRIRDEIRDSFHEFYLVTIMGELS